MEIEMFVDRKKILKTLQQRLIMPGGRKRKPTEMLKASGTYRDDRHANKMTLPLGSPTPRASVGDISRDAYEFIAERLTNVGVVSEIDTFALQMFSDAWEDYIAAREVIRRDGPTYTTTTNTGDIMFRPRPELAMMNNAWDRLKKIIPEFGMTPSSRAKIDAKDEVQDIDDLLL